MESESPKHQRDDREDGIETTAGELPLAFSVKSVSEEFAQIESELAEMASAHLADVEKVQQRHRASAVNMLHYVALRRLDIHRLQRQLSEQGLSSLGQCEAHVLASICAIRAMLEGHPLTTPAGVLGFSAGRALLDDNTDALFGTRPAHRVPRIMVTLDERAASDYAHVRTLLERGMNVARVNGAHDSADTWAKMISNVRLAARELATECRIAIDLPGPKSRTGALEPGPQVVRLHPRRDLRGYAVSPARFRLVAREAEVVGSSRASIPVEASWLKRRTVGHEVQFVDTRGAPRRAIITRVSEANDAADAEIWDTAYLETGQSLGVGDDWTTVGQLPGHDQFHVLCSGDLLAIVAGHEPQPPWERGREGVAQITCSIPALFSSVKPGERVILDDGRFAGTIEFVSESRVSVRIDRAPEGGGRLRAEKGINLPDSLLAVPLIDDSDQELLKMAAEQADMISVSFVRSAADVDAIQQALSRLGTPELALVLKIETVVAFQNLPEILLHALRSPVVGVMIARGDLAVEVGFSRLAELQEEILWLAEASHLPVIWATEVLDTLARTGRPSRAEVTDAAMAQRAECVMLNKGPFIYDAIRELDDILLRMARHQRKKMPLLSQLTSWDHF